MGLSRTICLAVAHSHRQVASLNISPYSKRQQQPKIVQALQLQTRVMGLRTFKMTKTSESRTLMETSQQTRKMARRSKFLSQERVLNKLLKKPKIGQLVIMLSVSLSKLSFQKSNFLFLCTGRSLGSGTFGKVRIGTHTITGEKVAIKILEKDRIKDKGDVERVTREINILKKVRHPNVI